MGKPEILPNKSWKKVTSKNLGYRPTFESKSRMAFTRRCHQGTRVMALVRRSARPPGMPDAFDHAPLR